MHTPKHPKSQGCHFIRGRMFEAGKQVPRYHCIPSSFIIRFFFKLNNHPFIFHLFLSHTTYYTGAHLQLPSSSTFQFLYITIAPSSSSSLFYFIKHTNTTCSQLYRVDNQKKDMTLASTAQL